MKSIFKKKLLIKNLNVFSLVECNEIIGDFHLNRKHLKLSTEHGVERISSYEIDYDYLSPKIKELIDDKVKKVIKPITGGKKGMIFGVRYSLDTKSYMEEHYDCNTYSCVISLNGNFTGGGTYFPFSGEVIKPGIGNGILFRADTLNSYHSAYPIEEGIRYVLVIRMEKNNSIFVFFKALFLFFVDKYIRKNKNILYLKPLI